MCHSSSVDLHSFSRNSEAKASQLLKNLEVMLVTLWTLNNIYNHWVSPALIELAQLECEMSVLHSIHSFGELKRCITWTDNMLWTGGHYVLERCLIHESQNFVRHSFTLNECYLFISTKNMNKVSQQMVGMKILLDISDSFYLI